MDRTELHEGQTQCAKQIRMEDNNQEDCKRWSEIIRSDGGSKVGRGHNKKPQCPHQTCWLSCSLMYFQYIRYIKNHQNHRLVICSRGKAKIKPHVFLYFGSQLASVGKIEFSEPQSSASRKQS